VGKGKGIGSVEAVGRNPWLAYSRELVRERADWSRTKEGTAQERERKLRHLGKIVRSLHEGGRLTTRNPAGMGERDIMNLFGHLKEQGLKPGTMLKYLGIMSQLCALAGNAIISQLRAHPVKAQWLPHGSGKAGKRSFRLETVMSFLDVARARAEKSDAWWDVVAYGLVAFAAGFGVRPKELRALEYADLERYCWRLRVGFSKTVPDYTTLLPPVRPHVERFLELREAHLGRQGHPRFFPELAGPGMRESGETVTSHQVRKMFSRIGKDAGVDIAPKDLRTSYGQVLMDCGATIETTSRLLRHASVATTQRWYVDLRPDDSYDKLQALFGQPPQKPKDPKYMEMHP